MPGDGAVLDLGRPLADHDHVPDQAAGVVPTAWLASGTTRPQARGELAPQGAAALDEQALVDGLVAHLHVRLARMLPPERHRDLLGRPVQLKHRLDRGPQADVAGELGRPGPAGPAVTGELCSPGAVPTSAPVRPYFARDRRRCACQAAADRPVRLPGKQPPADLLAIDRREAPRRALRAPWLEAARVRQGDEHHPALPADRPGNVVGRLTRADPASDLHALDVGDVPVALAPGHPLHLLRVATSRSQRQCVAMVGGEHRAIRPVRACATDSWV